MCRECNSEIYRSLSHKRFLLVGDDSFQNFLKTLSWQDIEYISFAESFVDVIYLDEIINPQHKETTNESTQISLV